jgi:hypothetical protein
LVSVTEIGVTSVTLSVAFEVEAGVVVALGVGVAGTGVGVAGTPTHCVNGPLQRTLKTSVGDETHPPLAEQLPQFAVILYAPSVAPRPGGGFGIAALKAPVNCKVARPSGSVFAVALSIAGQLNGPLHEKVRV